MGFLLVWAPVGAAVGKLLVPAGRAGLGRGNPSAALPTLASGHVLVAEILVLGTGERVERLHPAMLKHMRESGIAVEVQDTVRRGVQRGAYRQRPSERGGSGTGNPPLGSACPRTDRREGVVCPVGKGCISCQRTRASLPPFSISQPNACATFNFLTSEKRVAAAGLIPPRGTYKGM